MYAGRSAILTGFLVFLLCAQLPFVLAADDSNSGQLTQAQTISPQEISATLTTLGQGMNDPQLQSLVSQFESQLSSGDNGAAASTLLKLQNLAGSSAGQDIPDSMKALLQSLSVGQNGVTISPQMLSSLLGLANPSSSGMPGNVRNQSPQTVSLDLQALASLMKYLDPTLAKEMLDQASLLGGNQPTQSAQNNPLTLPPIPSGALSPSLINPPALKVGSPAAVSTLDPLAVATPMVLIAAALTIFLSRGRLGRALGKQSLPGISQLDDEASYEFDQRDPRKTIMHYFGRAVSLMRSRGVSKLRFETHREFSSRCQDRPERRHVTRISELYEKAHFSADEVVSPEADEAAREFSMMEKSDEV